MDAPTSTQGAEASFVPARRRLRLVPYLAAGLVLLGSAFQASLARGTDSGRSPGPMRAYGPGGGGRRPGVGPASIEEDSGLGTGELFGIAAGSAGAIAGGAILAGGGKGDECAERYPDLPADVRRVSEIRLVPLESTLDAGRCVCVHLEVRSGDDGKWYSATNRPEATIATRQSTECLKREEGSRNRFCVPITASEECDGRTVVLVGTLALPGQPVLTAEARVLVRVRAESR